jgi:hypothetical protein
LFLVSDCLWPCLRLPGEVPHLLQLSNVFLLLSYAPPTVTVVLSPHVFIIGTLQWSQVPALPLLGPLQPGASSTAFRMPRFALLPQIGVWQEPRRHGQAPAQKFPSSWPCIRYKKGSSLTSARPIVSATGGFLASEVQITSSSPAWGKSLTLFAPFCAEPAPDGPWPNFVRWCLAPPRDSYYPSPKVRTRFSPRSFFFSVSKIPANMQNLFNSYLLNHNSEYKVFYMKVYQKNA